MRARLGAKCPLRKWERLGEICFEYLTRSPRSSPREQEEMEEGAETVLGQQEESHLHFIRGRGHGAMQYFRSLLEE